jgi:hypothetical protein
MVGTERVSRAILQVERPAALDVMPTVALELTLAEAPMALLAKPSRFPWREHVAGRVITVTKKLLDHPQVISIDLSDELLDTPVEAKS